MTIEEAVLALKRYQGYEPMEDGNILKHSFDLTDETVDTLLSAMRTELAGEPLTLEQLQHMDEQRELASRMREMAVNAGGLDFCWGCGYEHSLGVHGCAVLKRAADLLDQAVDITTPIPLDRLRELVEADRDGRVKILPVSEENTCGACGHFHRTPGLNSGTCDVQSRYKNKRGQEDAKRGLFTPYQSRIACKRYLPKEESKHE